VKIFNYFKESYNELVHKVTWPSWEVLQVSAIVVMIASFIIALVIALMDLAFKNLMTGIYGIFY
jgi:preprotein translocase subunit SecE